MFAVPLPYPYPSVGASKYACSCELAVFEGSLMSIAVVSTCNICTISHSTKLIRLNTCYAVHTRNWKTILVVRARMPAQSRCLRIRRFEGWNYGEPRWYATVGHDSKPMLGHPTEKFVSPCRHTPGSRRGEIPRQVVPALARHVLFFESTNPRNTSSCNSYASDGSGT